MFIVTTVTFVLATVFVFARIISRFVLLRRRTWDDWLMILAWVSLLACAQNEVDRELTNAISPLPWACLVRLIMESGKDWGDMMPISHQHGFMLYENPNMHLLSSTIQP